MKPILRYITIQKWVEHSGVDEAFGNQIAEFAADNQIASVRMPGSDTLLVSLESLETFLDGMINKTPIPNNESSSRQQLINSIISLAKLLGSKVTKRGKYYNINPRTAGSRVYAQIHLPKAESYSKYSGVFLVVPDGQDFNYPDDIFPTDAKLTDLYGDYGPNASWIRGDSIRGTTSTACIFHLPITICDDTNEIEKVKVLLETANEAR